MNMTLEYVSQRCLYQQPAARHGGYDICVGDRRITAVGKHMLLFLPLSSVTVLMLFFDLFLVGFGAYVSVGRTISSCLLCRILFLLWEGEFHFLFFPFFRSFFLPLSHVQISFPRRHFLSDISFLFIPIPNLPPFVSLIR